MSAREIRETVRDFGQAARNAIEAGFDGVQIQGGYHYLFNQFLHPLTNVRRDAYGGSTENRARFLFEVIEEMARVVDRGRIGVKTGPTTLESGAFVSGEETLPTFEYVIDRLNDYELSHLLLMGPMADLSATPIAHLRGDEMFRHFRRVYRGNMIANVSFRRLRPATLAARFAGLALVGAVVGLLLVRLVRRRRFRRRFAAPRITPEELRRRMDLGEPFYVIDLRHPARVAADGRSLPGSVRLTPDQVIARRDRIPTDRDIVVFCSCPAEATAVQVAVRLRDLGVARVYPLQGGIDAWQRSGYPLDVAGASRGRSRSRARR